MNVHTVKEIKIKLINFLKIAISVFLKLILVISYA